MKECTENKNEKFKNQIEDLISQSSDALGSRISRSSKLKELRDFIFTSTQFLVAEYASANVKLSIGTRIAYVRLNLHGILRCQHCGKPLIKKITCACDKQQLPRFCSIKCAANSVMTISARKRTTALMHGGNENWNNSEKMVKTKLKKNNGQYNSDETNQKISQHCSLRRFEVREKGKQQKLIKYGDQNWNNRRQARETYQLKTGYDNPSQNPEVKQQKVLTTRKIFGVDYPLQNENVLHVMQQTTFNKHGYRTWLGSKEHKELAKDKEWQKRRFEAQRKTMQANGSKMFFQTDEFKQLMNDKEWQNKRMNAVHETKARNCTFNTSKQEDLAYDLLKQLMPRLQRQFKSKSYPFAADFYDPNQPNARFEFNGSWTHGGMPFKEDDIACQLQLLKWKNRSQTSKYYANAIKTWTIRDTLKREIAKKNGITLVEFWSLDDVKDYIFARSK